MKCLEKRRKLQKKLRYGDQNQKILNVSKRNFGKRIEGTSLVVQWLTVHASTAGSIGLSLVGKLWSHTLCREGTEITDTHREQKGGVQGDEAAAAAAKSLQSCPTLCDPIDGSPPGSPVPGILQARTLEWGAIAFSGDKARIL